MWASKMMGDNMFIFVVGVGISVILEKWIIDDLID